VDSFVIIAGIVLLYLGVLIVPYLWAPRGYSVSDRAVVVKRVIGGLEIHPIGEPERWGWTWWGIRLFGSGGMYGYFGLFSFKGLGRVWMHATNRHNLVLIKTRGGKEALISPRDPDSFIKLFE
ncbi:MAG: PH domain-containing protein, partial [Candidatus Bathyarchaeia archaeon]